MTRFLAPTSVLLLVVLHTMQSNGDDATTARKVLLPTPAENAPMLSSALLDSDLESEPGTLPDNWESHPLGRALTFALQHQEYIAKHVKDFSCILAKRERINGRLNDYEYLRTRVRREQQQAAETVPFSVFVEFLAPKKLVGRKVLYIDGSNDGKLLVRKGGLRFGHVILNIVPTSDAALRESRYPITQLGLDNVVSRLIEQARHDIIADPDAENTEVTFFRKAEIDGRVCTHIRVTHPQEDHQFDFHEANIYVDDKLHVPLRFESFTWPKNDDEEAVLIEEYTYMRLKLNVGLTDRDFSEELVRGQPLRDELTAE